MVNTPVLEEQQNKGSQTALSTVCITVILLCALMTGYLPQKMLSFAVLAMCAVLMATGEIYLAFPVMLFYNVHFGIVMGLAVYRYFSFMLLAGTFLMFKNLKLKTIQVAPFILFMFYCLIVIAPDALQVAIFAVVDLLCILLLINHYLDNNSNLKRFFTVYAYTALVAYVTGRKVPRTASTDVMMGKKVVELVRNCATFEDPNYAGCFYTIAVFALVTLKIFKPAVRTVIVIALYAIMLSTMSVTAILANAVLWFLYLLITKKMNAKTGIVIVLVVAVLLGLYNYGLQNPKDPVLGMFSYRISEKITALDAGNYNDVTTNRTNLSERHMEYFKGQSPFRMLVGFNAASLLKTDLDGFRVAAHNEYVDLLLNVGMIGAIIWIGIILRQVFTAFSKYTATKNELFVFFVIVKCTWLIYAATLTMFGDYRFSFLFFL